MKKSVSKEILMAIKALICPQCGSNVELDDDKEFGFCTSCGSKIQLNETINIHHSGNVQLDTTDQGMNKLALGNRAFEARNYDEAYEYLTRALEDIPDDFKALYRKGICAVYLAKDDEHLRQRELHAAVRAANEVRQNKLSSLAADSPERNDWFAATAQEDADLATLSRNVMDEAAGFRKKLGTEEECEEQAELWTDQIALLNYTTGAITDETVKEPVLSAAIDLCDQFLECEKKGTVTYYSHTTTDNKGRTKDHYDKFSMGADLEKNLRSARQEMADRYNRLSQRVEQELALSDQLRTLEEDSARLKGNVDDAKSRYDDAKKRFWASNPDLDLRRRKIRGMTWIAAGIGAAVLLVLLLLSKVTTLLTFNKALVFGILAVIIGVVIKFVLSRFLRGRLEKKYFPQDLRALEESLNDANRLYSDKRHEYSTKKEEFNAFNASKK